MSSKRRRFSGGAEGEGGAGGYRVIRVSDSGHCHVIFTLPSPATVFMFRGTEEWPSMSSIVSVADDGDPIL